MKLHAKLCEFHKKKTIRDKKKNCLNALKQVDTSKIYF